MGSKVPARHFDPPMLGIKTIWSSSCGLRFISSPKDGDQSISSTRSWDQKWPARQFVPPMLGIETFWSQLWPSHSFDPRIVGIKPLIPIKKLIAFSWLPSRWFPNKFPHTWNPYSVRQYVHFRNRDIHAIQGNGFATKCHKRLRSMNFLTSCNVMK
jgi:hypothetical protein